MSVGVTITIQATNNRGSDAKAAAKMDKTDPDSDLTEDLRAMNLVIPVDSDVTSITSPGHIQRVIQAHFDLVFIESYPDDPTRIAVLTGAVRSMIQQRVPTVVNSETVVLF